MCVKGGILQMVHKPSFLFSLPFHQPRSLGSLTYIKKKKKKKNTRLFLEPQTCLFPASDARSSTMVPMLQMPCYAPRRLNLKTGSSLFLFLKNLSPEVTT